MIDRGSYHGSPTYPAASRSVIKSPGTLASTTMPDKLVADHAAPSAVSSQRVCCDAMPWSRSPRGSAAEAVCARHMARAAAFMDASSCGTRSSSSSTATYPQQHARSQHDESGESKGAHRLHDAHAVMQCPAGVDLRESLPAASQMTGTVYQLFQLSHPYLHS